MYDIEAGTLHCDCLNFELDGFPCRHQIRVLKLQDMTHIPSSLIMNRWTKATKITVPPYFTKEAEPEMLQRMCFTSLSSRSNRMIYVASHIDDSFKRAALEIDRITTDLEQSCKLDDPSVGLNRMKTSVKDRARKRSKGKQVLTTSAKVRKCTHCKKEGHNKTTCPEMKLHLYTGAPSYASAGHDRLDASFDDSSMA